MKNNYPYVFICLLTFSLLKAQIRQLELVHASSQLFNGHLYSYGISARKSNAALYVYKLDLKLNVLDSFVVEGTKGTADSFLQTYSDTLHDYLNIYFQKKEKKAVTVLRFNKKFDLIASIENVDVARLNNTAIFSSETHYFKNTVYSLKTESDSSGKQFYLNKYLLKSETTNFDYEFKWQFPFERKNIHSAHIFSADKNHVFLFVHVGNGTKAGQWILKVDSENGKLEKATKLNDKDETSSYQFGSSFIDKNGFVL